MGLLDRAGARLTARPEDAEILVVNTCSFIDAAKQESVSTILEMARHKTTGHAKKLIVAGCLVERYRDEIRKNIPEVDAVIGTGELESILEVAGLEAAGRAVGPGFSPDIEPDSAAGALAPEVSFSNRAPAAAPSPFNILTSTHAEVRSGRESQSGTHKGRPEAHARALHGRFLRDAWAGASSTLPTYLYDDTTPRLLSTPRASAYIKIAEGCDHPCTFCVIPNLRGKFRSRRFESVIAEAEQLVARGVREITLIGQDTTCYGEDLGLRDGLATLLDALARIPNLKLAALPLRLPQPHHRQTARNHRETRQHLQISRPAAAARVA